MPINILKHIVKKSFPLFNSPNNSNNLFDIYSSDCYNHFIKRKYYFLLRWIYIFLFLLCSCTTSVVLLEKYNILPKKEANQGEPFYFYIVSFKKPMSDIAEIKKEAGQSAGENLQKIVEKKEGKVVKYHEVVAGEDMKDISVSLDWGTKAAFVIIIFKSKAVLIEKIPEYKREINILVEKDMFKVTAEKGAEDDSSPKEKTMPDIGGIIEKTTQKVKEER